MAKLGSRHIKSFIDIEKADDGTYRFRVITNRGYEYPSKRHRLHSKFICDESFKRLEKTYKESNE